MRSVDEASELIDLLDQLLGTQPRRANTVCWVKKIEIAKVAFKLLPCGFLGEQADVMGLVVRGDLEAGKYHDPARL